ncbi:quinone oxidoreductase [Corynebacterium sp. CNCTC7651]|uniref:quinone oxidoreductase family protein n=1 Tax=Corynebacterium sp. CNCTC7651 TaxID=2815361 RepID=UPI001F254E58|nr:quinone oxidoreductase [Corynebacterium sp. CNCTC7651]UIZ93201.1 quinone oxidoreductase [Corynebacterium sp. CNCTC7651]
MKAIEVSSHGGPEVLTYTDIEAPTPTQEQVLIDVSFAGVNFIDTYFRSGAYPSELPYVPGSEGCGRVAFDPSGEIPEGTLVAFNEGKGTYAEQTVVNRGRIVAVPEGVAPEVAASMLLQGMTAHYLITDAYPVSEETSLVITAGAGGVGLMLTQLASAKGAKVYSVVSTEEKAELAREVGATGVFHYGDNLADQIREANGGQGVDVVFDGVGKDTFQFALDVVRPRGLVCSFGSASGDVTGVDLQQLKQAGSVFVTRPMLAHYTATDEEFRARAQAVARAVEDGTLTVRVQEPYELADARKAHEDLEARKTTGSVVIRTSASTSS